MKKAFTLVELLVVVVVIVTLMAITFKLGGVGSDSTARNKTVNRLQRLENCLSGYYAAYGTYPPVKLHGSRDWTLQVDPHGIQIRDRGKENELVWESVEAACRSQPVGMSYPFKYQSSKDYVSAISSMLMERNPGKPYYQFEALLNNSTISSKENDIEWMDQQIFQYGVLSYILPRYLIMMGGDTTGNDQIFNNQAAWKVNNQLPADFDTGIPYSDWRVVNNIMKEQPYKIAALPSQAACARWLPNLERSISTMSSFSVYGIELRDGDDSGLAPLRVYTAGNSESYSQQYLLDGMTIKDGWGHEFYYYSPPPHQSYRLWSAGKNGKTFPPWVSSEEMSSGVLSRKKSTIQDWISDDITQMSN